MNASWTASSARSKSPMTRIRVATARPCSSRNRRSTTAWAARDPADGDGASTIVSSRWSRRPAPSRRRPVRNPRPAGPRSIRSARPGSSPRRRSPRRGPPPRPGRSPPSVSFVSANGPSVVIVLPSTTRTVVAVVDRIERLAGEHRAATRGCAAVNALYPAISAAHRLLGHVARGFRRVDQQHVLHRALPPCCGRRSAGRLPHDEWTCAEFDSRRRPTEKPRRRDPDRRPWNRLGDRQGRLGRSRRRRRGGHLLDDERRERRDAGLEDRRETGQHRLRGTRGPSPTVAAPSASRRWCPSSCSVSTYVVLTLGEPGIGICQ